MSDLEILYFGIRRGVNFFLWVCVAATVGFIALVIVMYSWPEHLDKTYCFGDGHDEVNCMPFPPGCSASTPSGVNGCP